VQEIIRVAMRDHSRMAADAGRLGDPDQRVSDVEREQAVAWLQQHLVSDRLTLEEFSERVEQAYAARYYSPSL
jgi:hypothetical protein